MLERVLTKLNALRDEAEKMAHRFQNELGAAGMRYAIDEIERTLIDDRDRLVGPKEALAFSGYSRRQLRRLVAKRRLTNHGRPRAPLYRISELPVKPGQRLASEPIAEKAAQAVSPVTSAAIQIQTPDPDAGVSAPASDTPQVIWAKPARRGRDAAIESRAKEMANRRRQTRVA
jgi:hypothetical protein